MTRELRTPAGGRVRRDRPLRFSFDGRNYSGLVGDTLASALLANGVHLVGRSFKYHRPRGIQSAGSEEANALVTVSRDAGRTTPNLRATQVELYDGLVAHSQNRWPTLAFDAGAVNDLLSPLLPAGFYYKTFMWPKAFWERIYEPRIRAAAGFGRAPETADPDRYQQRYAHCDVLVIGAGPAGLAAALAAMEAGARVIICDEGPEFGGSLLAEPHARLDGAAAEDWRIAAVAELAASDRVTCLPRTTAFTANADGFYGLAERITDHMAVPDPRLPRERLWQVRARHAVIAAGALERPLVFPENDRPGVVLADAARAYLNRYGVLVGRDIVVATACDSAYQAALDLKAAGASIVAVADIRPSGGSLTAVARDAGIPVHLGTTVCGTMGRLRVKAVELGTIDGAGVTGGRFLRCDAVLMSGGWTPSVNIFSMSRGKLRHDPASGTFLPGTYHEAQTSAGGCNGTFDLEAAISEGLAAGASAAASLGLGAPASRRVSVSEATSMRGGATGELPHGRDATRVKAFVDFQHDVTAKDIRLAVREGFRSIEHVKRYTTTGMATDQGKASNLNALSIAAEALGVPVPSVGLTTFRPPYTPTTFGIYAGAQRGDLFDPVRLTPSHDWAVARGAVFEPVGLWRRARYFPRPGEDMHAAVTRECLAVRSAVGMCDASTLGKIEVVGPDAAEFLNRIYVNPLLKLDVGRCRYAILTREDGFVYDDGVIGRLAPDRFHVTTTTGGAAGVANMMEDYLQTEWPDLKVWLTSTTDQWATVAVQGPKAREVVAALTDIDVSAAAMPHMSLRVGTCLGVPCRLFRMSFTGELGYEINVPASHGPALWQAVWEAGQGQGIVAYGTEAIHVLRAEKGYIIVGQETDGTVTPDDAGLGWAVGRSKPDFVGKRGMTRPDLVRADRRQVVGLVGIDPSVVLEEGAQIVDTAEPAVGTHAIGHVTSAYMSPALGHGIALALVERGRARTGETLYVPMPGGAIPVRVVEPVFYDREGSRLNA